MLKKVILMTTAVVLIPMVVMANDACQPACQPACCDAVDDCAVVCPAPMTGILGMRAARAQNRYLNTMSRQQMIQKIRCAIKEYRDNRCRLAFTSTCNMLPVPGGAGKCCKPCCAPACCAPPVQPPCPPAPCAELEAMKVPITLEAMVCIPPLKVPAIIGVEPEEVVVNPTATIAPTPTLAPPLPE